MYGQGATAELGTGSCTNVTTLENQGGREHRQGRWNVAEDPPPGNVGIQQQREGNQG